MNVIFISPQFPYYYYNFCQRLKDRGANVLGIGDTPYDLLSNETKEALTEYYYVESLEDYESVYRAVGYYIHKNGRIDWIESENEYWLELEAKLRTDFHVVSGPQIEDMIYLRHKSKMKEMYKKAGIPCAKYIYFDDLEEAFIFVKEVGYPVICKPDDGMGAKDTYKIHNDEELINAYHHKEESDIYILEDFIPGNIETFEGVTNKKGEILICSSQMMCDGVMDMVNKQLDTTFYTKPAFGTDLYDIGEKTVKAFQTKSRFFHFEFIRLNEDKDYLGKKGDLVALEVNMRAPGAYIPEMMNYAYDVDIYTVWADMLLYDQCFYDVDFKYYVGYVGRRKGRNYNSSNDELRLRYHGKLVLEADVPEVLAKAMSDHVFIYRTKEKKELLQIMNDMIKPREEEKDIKKVIHKKKRTLRKKH